MSPLPVLKPPPGMSAPPQPKTILRGHRSQVHAACFVWENERLVTGDADGYVVVWDLTTMRPSAVWRAHEKSILGVRGWGRTKLITHGRDNELTIWQYSKEAENNLSKETPLHPSMTTTSQAKKDHRPKPWVERILPVNAMNFCAFSACSVDPDTDFDQADEIFLAAPNSLELEGVDIYHVPSQHRKHVVQVAKGAGMVMAITIGYGRAEPSSTPEESMPHTDEGPIPSAGTQASRKRPFLVATGYENGQTTVALLAEDGVTWQLVYDHKPHTQPILSLQVSPCWTYYLTCAADALIAKHPLPAGTSKDTETTTADIESRDSPDQMNSEVTKTKNPSTKPKSLLSAALQASSDDTFPPQNRVSPPTVQTEPLYKTNTRHAGQQGLSIRSDARIFATGGWDGLARVYSTESLEEVAVLQWHTTGCYTTAFALIRDTDDALTRDADEASPITKGQTDGSAVLAPSSRLRVPSVKEQRLRQALHGHWIAVGAKDGRVSLWIIY